MNGLRLAIDLPDLWQQQAVRALREGFDVVLDAPTGAGKTRVFELFVESDTFRRATGQAVYTVPTRALANDKYREWQARRWNVGIATGDVTHHLHAPILVATLETQRERILTGEPPRLLVIDEYQMIADPRRGVNYELAIALPPADSTQLLLLSGSVRNPQDVVQWLQRLGRRVTLIRVEERPVPLDEVPVERLPRVPATIQGFWSRLAAGAVLAQLTPLLIFAPRRAEAEKIATRIAAALPLDSPIPLTPEQERLLGRDLSRLLQHRVAYHHSGLPYAARAGFIEPLAKNGHLRVIVSTTGLAAGINFSVRSVLISSTTYQDGPFTRELSPDELLQMFGRAGRRGLDDLGHVLYANDTPRLHHASPRQLRRTNQVDWPTLLRIMEHAADNHGDPFASVTEACQRLFSKQTIRLGFESTPTEDPDSSTNSRTAPATDHPHHYGPTREEYLDSHGHWQPRSAAQTGHHPLSECLARRGDRWLPALRAPSAIEPLGPGRLCKLPRGSRQYHYGKEITVGHHLPDNTIRPAPWVRRALHLQPAETFTPDDFLATAAPLLLSQLPAGAHIEQLVRRGSSASLQIAFDQHLVPTLTDPSGRPLIAPPRRRAALSSDTTYTSGSTILNPPPGTAARAWRSLGLVEPDGTPTPRGRIFSHFQAGEGLAIAAALEDLTYPADDIVRHIANLRGGHRFTDLAGKESDRLAMATRGAYGHLDFEGYLTTGLPPGYGEGTWEAIHLYLTSGFRALAGTPILRGDLERAILEWQSLLRHIAHAPDARAPRWNELQAAATSALHPRSEHLHIDWANQLPPIFLQPRTDLRP